MAKRSKKAKKNPYQEVTDKIIAALEEGVGLWNRPWAVAGGFLNASTGKSYRGINTLLLSLAMHGGGFELPIFLTFNQAKAKGAQVLKGSKGTQLCFFKWIEKANDPAVVAEGGDENSVYPLMRFFTVFNVAQTDLDPESYAELLPKRTDVETDQALEAFLRDTGARISFGGDRAFYSPHQDSIALPPIPHFHDAGAYYATAFHELTHWTGHPGRLDRDLRGRFGSESYAAEELVAEMGSAFLCSEFGVEGTLQHPEYIANWIKVLKEDNKAIFTATSKAQKACDFLKSSAGEQEAAQAA